MSHYTQNTWTCDHCGRKHDNHIGVYQVVPVGPEPTIESHRPTDRHWLDHLHVCDYHCAWAALIGALHRHPQGLVLPPTPRRPTTPYEQPLWPHTVCAIAALACAISAYSGSPVWAALTGAGIAITSILIMLFEARGG